MLFGGEGAGLARKTSLVEHKQRSLVGNIVYLNNVTLNACR